MPEPVIYIRGITPPFVDTAAVNSAMVADLKAVSTLTDDETSTLRERLSAAKGFLDSNALAAEIRRVIKADETVRSVRTTLQNLERKDAELLVKHLAERGKQEKDFLLNEVDLARLGKILPNLIQAYPALARFEKAERLAKLTGQELESIELICDLRPIFDEDRKQIEGMMPYTRLRIVATGADGLPKSFEAELTHRQVKDLREKASKANAKLDVLRKSVESWLPEGLPNLPLTRVPTEESSDV